MGFTTRTSLWLLWLLALTHGYALCVAPVGAKLCSARAAPPRCLQLGGPVGPRLRQLTSAAAFAREIQMALDDNVMAVVVFTQPKCRSCTAMKQKLNLFARRKEDYRVFDVDVTTQDGARIVQAVGGVTGAPTISVFDRGEMIYSKATPVRLYPEFEAKLDVYDQQILHDAARPKPRPLDELDFA